MVLGYRAEVPLAAWSILEKMFGAKPPPDLLRQRIVHLYGLTAIEMARQDVQHRTSSVLHIYQPDVLKLLTNLLQELI